MKTELRWNFGVESPVGGTPERIVRRRAAFLWRQGLSISFGAPKNFNGSEAGELEGGDPGAGDDRDGSGDPTGEHQLTGLRAPPSATS